MTLKRFEELLKMVNPNIRIRQRGYGDIAAVFLGISGKSGYLMRMNKGELELNGYRMAVVDPNQGFKKTLGHIKKRGRHTVLRFLRDRRHLSWSQASKIRWGINPV